MPSYDTESHAPPSAEWFSNWLMESANDFRVSESLLHGMLFAMFGLGDSAYKESFNLFAKSVQQDLVTLSAKPLMKPVYGDWQEDISLCFEKWQKELIEMLRVWLDSVSVSDGASSNASDKAASARGCDSCSNNCSKNLTSGEEDVGNRCSDDEENAVEQKDSFDLEDMGNMMRRGEEMDGEEEVEGKRTKEMLTPLIRESLTKQGYKLIGKWFLAWF